MVLKIGANMQYEQKFISHYIERLQEIMLNELNKIRFYFLTNDLSSYILVFFLK